jgi:SAM-dependent methyltransferase
VTDPYRPRREQQSGPLLPLVLSYLFSLGTVLRWLDMMLLAWRPGLLRAYLATWRTSIERTPYADGAFDKLHDARKHKKSILELTYGETPVVGAVRLLKAAGARPGQKLVDLGCGRGRLLIAARYLKMEARGVELVQSHVDETAPLLEKVGASVEYGDAESADFADADWVYLAWTCFSAGTRERVGARLGQLKAGARVITLDLPLDAAGFEPVLERRLFCSWGRVPVYVYERAA